jgi:hypothetical protein
MGATTSVRETTGSRSIYADVSLFRQSRDGVAIFERDTPAPGCVWSGESTMTDIKSATNEMRESIVSHLLGNPIEFANTFRWNATLNVPAIQYIPTDDGCRCEWTEIAPAPQPADEERQRRRRSCSIVKPLGPEGAVGIPYLAECDNVTDKFILKRSPLPQLPLDITIMRSDVIMARLTDARAYTKALALNCVADVPAYLLGSPELVNETLIGYVLQYIMNPTPTLNLQYSGAPVFRAHTYIQQYDAFLCSKKSKKRTPAAYNVMELASLGELSTFLTKVVEGDITEYGNLATVLLNVCQQLVLTLYYLQKYYGFTHGDLKSKNVFVKQLDPQQYPYVIEWGVQYKVPNLGFVACVADYGKCAVSLPTVVPSSREQLFVRLYTRRQMGEALLRRLSRFTPKVYINKETNETSYRLSGDETMLTIGLFFLGLPTLLSLDTYAIIASVLLISPKVLKTMLTVPQLREMLLAIFPWTEHHLEVQVHAYIKSKPALKQRMRIKFTYAFLKNTNLYCNASKKALDALFPRSR